MENKINIAQLLKDCPKGMELNCTICNGVKFIELDRNPNFPIVVRANNGYEFTLTKYGQVHNIDDAKCVIFPKGKTTWEGFQRPFKDGDVVFVRTCYEYIAIYKDTPCDDLCKYAAISCSLNNIFLCKDNPLCNKLEITNIRLATEEEKARLFQAIKDNGYKWNLDTKTLEKLVQPKFKVGDEVKSIFNNNRYIITALTDTHYTLVEVENNFKYIEPIIEDKNWELASNKFDINTLVPFKSEVLVRMFNDGKWYPSFWGCYLEDIDCHYVTTKGNYKQCIPYVGNEHLLGTNNDCDKYFKIWES